MVFILVRIKYHQHSHTSYGRGRPEARKPTDTLLQPLLCTTPHADRIADWPRWNRKAEICKHGIVDTLSHPRHCTTPQDTVPAGSCRPVPGYSTRKPGAMETYPLCEGDLDPAFWASFMHDMRGQGNSFSAPTLRQTCWNLKFLSQSPRAQLMMI